MCDFRVDLRVGSNVGLVGVIISVRDTVGSKIMLEDSIVFVFCDAYIEGIVGFMQWI